MANGGQSDQYTLGQNPEPEDALSFPASGPSTGESRTVPPGSSSDAPSRPGTGYPPMSWGSSVYGMPELEGLGLLDEFSASAPPEYTPGYIQSGYTQASVGDPLSSIPGPGELEMFDSSTALARFEYPTGYTEANYTQASAGEPLSSNLGPGCPDNTNTQFSYDYTPVYTQAAAGGVPLSNQSPTPFENISPVYMGYQPGVGDPPSVQGDHRNTSRGLSQFPGYNTSGTAPEGSRGYRDIPVHGDPAALSYVAPPPNPSPFGDITSAYDLPRGHETLRLDSDQPQSHYRRPTQMPSEQVEESIDTCATATSPTPQPSSTSPISSMTNRLQCPIAQMNILLGKERTCPGVNVLHVSNVRYHLTTAHSLFAKTCPNCKITFIDKTKFETYHGYVGGHCRDKSVSRAGNSQAALWTLLCREIYPTATELPSPYKEDEPEAEPEAENLTCEDCGQEFTEQRYLKRHQNNKKCALFVKDKGWCCDASGCSRVFESRQALYDHRRKH